MQQCDKHISPVVNQHATIEGAVLYVGAALRLYRVFPKELYNFESLYKFIQRTYTTF
jgi:hypothetical protein